MRLLITGASTRLSRQLATELSQDHDVTLTDTSDVQVDGEFVRSDLGDDLSTSDLVKHVDAIVHSGEVDPDASVSDQLDYQMRCTYNLLWAASEEDVSRVVYLSSLDIMEHYPEEYVATEQWRPVPTTDSQVLSYHLGEYVCREFAREYKIDVACLRLGDLVWDASGVASSSALFFADAVSAVSAALSAEIKGWNLFHVQSAVPDARFLTTKAQEVLDFQPTGTD